MSIINALRLDGSPYLKQQILKNQASPMWKRAFYYAYHPDMQFGINRLTDSNQEIGEPSEDMFELLDKLANRDLTGNNALNAVKEFMDENGSLIALICRKDMNCGVTATTLNKVFGDDFIPQFKVQLAKEVPVNQIFYPVVGQLKYDGVRVVALVEENKVTFKTRNGKTFKYPKLAEQILSNGFTDYILDGELVQAGGKSVDRTSVSGTVNSAIHGTPINRNDLEFVVFDYMHLEAFNKGKCLHNYESRWDGLTAVLMFMGDTMVKQVECYEFKSAKEVNEKFAELVAEGYEGLILKKWKHLYTFKRSADWVKVKEIKDCTLTCVDIEYGAPGTKYEDCVGALVCDGIVDGKYIKTNVGSGLSDALRNVSNPYSYFVGAKIDVKYNSIIQDKTTGEWSLFLPRFTTLRGDL